MNQDNTCHRWEMTARRMPYIVPCCTYATQKERQRNGPQVMRRKHRTPARAVCELSSLARRVCPCSCSDASIYHSQSFRHGAFVHARVQMLTYIACDLFGRNCSFALLFKCSTTSFASRQKRRKEKKSGKEKMAKRHINYTGWKSINSNRAQIISK